MTKKYTHAQMLALIPQTMEQTIDFKCFAALQLQRIDEEIKILRKRKKVWNRRYGEGLRRIGEIATRSKP